MMSPSEIGQEVWLKAPGKTWEGPFLVVDAAARGDIFPIVKFRHEVAEIDWNLAIKWGMVTQSGDVLAWRLDNVQVSKINPISLDGCPVDFPSWWLDQVRPAEAALAVKTPQFQYPRSWRINGEWIHFSSPTRLDARKEQELWHDYLSCD